MTGVGKSIRAGTIWDETQTAMELVRFTQWVLVAGVHATRLCGRWRFKSASAPHLLAGAALQFRASTLRAGRNSDNWTSLRVPLVVGHAVARQVLRRMISEAGLG